MKFKDTFQLYEVTYVRHYNILTVFYEYLIIYVGYMEKSIHG